MKLLFRGGVFDFVLRTETFPVSTGNKLNSWRRLNYALYTGCDRLRELVPAARGSQDAGSRNLEHTLEPTTLPIQLAAKQRILQTRRP